jgi:competence protein ComEA
MFMDLPKAQEDRGLMSIWSVYKVPIVLGSFSLFLAFLSILLLVKTSQSSEPIQFSHNDELGVSSDTIGVSTQSGQSANLGTILVDIEGAVGSPGIVELPPGSRVEDAIEAAGGLQKNADTLYISQNINRAMKVADGMKIYIPSLGEDMTSHTVGSNKNDMETSHNLDPLLRNGSISQNGSVSINMASKAQLESLPGVGPVTAQKIIDMRPYGRLEDLVTKKAIGTSLFEKLKNSLSL